MPTFSTGAFVWSTTENPEPRTPEDIAALADAHQIPLSIVPPYAGDRTSVSRALDASRSTLTKDGWVLRKIRSTPTLVVQAIMHETKDQAAETVDMTQQARVRWSCESRNGSHVEGDHPAARAVDTEYQHLRGKIVGADWTASITKYLLGDCMAQSMRSDGRVFYVPPHTLPQVKALVVFLRVIGIDLVINDIQPESLHVPQRLAENGLAKALEDLTAEVEAFDGSQNATTYRSRIALYQDLRKRATMYKEALGVGVEQAEAALATLETKVQAFLSLREQFILTTPASADPVVDPKW